MNQHDKNNSTCEVWLSFECNGGIVCTAFGLQSFAIRPLVGETLSFMPAKGSALDFKVSMAWGAMSTSLVSSEIESIGHYRAALAENLEFITSIRCLPIQVPTLEDAKVAAEYLVSQHGFEIDSYRDNKI